MLTVSRIEAGRVQLTVEQFDLVELVQQLYDELKITAEEKKLHFLMHSDQKMIFIKGDKEKIREVIQNLIGNAFKFTPVEGTVRTTIYEKDTNVVVKINNTGSYIPPEDLTKLFNKFSRLENASSTQEGRPQGTGLGLYITKQIVEMHKGSIVVESDKEAGTTFTITIPNGN
jgi:signal transduction histidine kinase